ncbi:MAG TPA: TRAM domain-containing protein [Myxococcota bacterium]|nr:TRAM domain-containing protein [Myxococcota bacterium]
MPAYRRRRKAIELELTIDRLASSGEGVARARDGRVVFVPFTAPGDRVRVRLTEQRKRFARAEVRELLAPGSTRTDPVCAVFGSCGGCAWQHVAYGAQLEAKRAIVADALTRIAGIALSGPPAIVPSPTPYAWRSRTRVLCEGGRVGYRRRHSHALQAVDRCPVLVPELDRALHALAKDPPAEDGEVELAQSGGLRVGSDALEISPGVFFQAHAGLRDALFEAALTAAGKGALAADLFAGAGFFTLELSRRFERVVAVEAEPAAAADLRRNAERAGRRNIELIEAPVERALAHVRDAETLLLDPPRTGLPRGVVETLAAGSASRVVYVSCEPSTLARDLAAFATRGLSLAQVTAFDLFPQTPHVEVLAVLARPAGDL